MYYLQKKLFNLWMFFKLQELMRVYPFNNERIIEIQNKKLKYILEYAYNNISIYRKKFEQAGITPRDIECTEDLYKIPPITKMELREYINSQVENNPKKYKYWIKDGTSGTTGMPLNIYLTPIERAVYNAKWLRVLKANGVSPLFQKSFAIVSPHRTNNAKSILQKLGLFRRETVTQVDDVSVIVEKYNRFKPDLIYSNKSQLVLMSLYAEKNKIKLHQPKILISVAETLDKISEKLIIKNFNCGQVIQSYGCTETATMAFKTINSNGKYFWCYDTNAFIVLNENGSISDKGKIYVTSLYQKGFPLINYDIGDYVETIEINGLRHIENIVGRQDDWIKFENGDLMSFHNFYEALEGNNNILQFRVIQEKYKYITIQLVKSIDSNKENNIIEKEILMKLNRMIISREIKYKFEWVDKIATDPNGKLRMLISKV